MTESPQQLLKQSNHPTPSNESYRTKTDDSHHDLLQTAHKALAQHYHNLKIIGHGAQATMLWALDRYEHPVAIKVFDY